MVEYTRTNKQVENIVPGDCVDFGSLLYEVDEVFIDHLSIEDGENPAVIINAHLIATTGELGAQIIDPVAFFLPSGLKIQTMR